MSQADDRWISTNVPCAAAVRCHAAGRCRRLGCRWFCGDSRAIEAGHACRRGCRQSRDFKLGQGCRRRDRRAEKRRRGAIHPPGDGQPRRCDAGRAGRVACRLRRHRGVDGRAGSSLDGGRVAWPSGGRTGRAVEPRGVGSGWGYRDQPRQAAHRLCRADGQRAHEDARRRPR